MEITRQQAIKLIFNITNQDDPFWMDLVEDLYDEENNDWPTITDVLSALGISEKEAEEAEKSTLEPPIEEDK